MKYSLKAQNIFEWLALVSGNIPTPVIDTGVAPLQAKCIVLAVRLGVFECLASKSKTSEEITKDCKLNKEALLFLLKILVSSGYLIVHKDSRFDLTKQTRKLFLPNSEKSIRNVILLSAIQWDFLAHLEDILKTGRAINFHHTLKDEHAWKIYQSAMLEIAKMMSGRIAKLIPVKPGSTLLLDIGGSHGLFGAAICRKHPPLRSIVIDLPEAIKVSRVLARENNIENIVEFKEANLLEEKIDIKSDVAFLGNILHHFERNEVEDLLKQVRDNLRENGTIAILEISLDSEDFKPDLITSAMSFCFRIMSASECYSAQTYCDWLDKLGFRDIKVKKMLESPLHRLIHARK